jgi:hypothetical protein
MTSNSAPTVGTRREIELLLLCARTRMGSETAARVEILLQEDIDWDYLLKKAREHAVMPLLYWNLNATCCLGVVPKNALNQLRDHFNTNKRRNVFLTGELLKLLNRFEAQRVPAVPYKGPPLASLAYGNLGLRKFVDLDVLVHKRDIPKARELMSSLGYRQQYQLTSAQEVAFLESQREYTFTNDNGSVVELHWAITPRYFSFWLDPEDLWERLEQTHLAGATVRTFSPEDLLLILCAHGSKHFWCQLGWVCDVAELVRVHEGMNWERLMKRANTLGGERMLFLGLFLANELLGAVLPEGVSQKVRTDRTVGALAQQVREWLFREVNGPPGIFAKGRPEESRFHPFRLKIRERFQDRVWYCASTALEPTIEDRTFLPLPKSLSPLYYILRPFRLTSKYGLRLLKRFT